MTSWNDLAWTTLCLTVSGFGDIAIASLFLCAYLRQGCAATGLVVAWVVLSVAGAGCRVAYHNRIREDERAKLQEAAR